MELQFTVGEAISSAAIGTSSGAARDPWTCTEDQYSPPQGAYFGGLTLVAIVTCMLLKGVLSVWKLSSHIGDGKLNLPQHVNS